MNCLTLFAGGGGADIGLQRAGFRHLACVEADTHACATLRAAGFPAVQAWIGTGQPERRARGKVLPPLPVFDAAAHPGSDLLWASPPCQPFSRAGKQLGAADERNGWPATLDAIRAARPRWVVVENVVGSPAEEWADELRALYPEVQVWRADAVDWGLPSHRDRVYVVAGPSRWTAPTPTHYGPGVPWLVRGGLQPWAGFGEALGVKHALHPSGRRYLSQPGPTVAATEYKGHTNPHLERGRNGPVNRASCANFLLTGNRVVTVAEAALLVGFPTGYPFQGSKEAQYRQIGNAVAPIMSEVIGRAILNTSNGAT